MAEYKLNPKFFDENMVLDSEVREMLLSMADSIRDSANEELDEKLPWNGTIMIGSLCSINYDDFSDIDLHLLIDYTGINERESNLLAEFLTFFIKNWNQNEFHIKNFLVEAFAQNINLKFQAEGVYELETEEWQQKPDLTNKIFYTPEEAKEAKSYLIRVKELRNKLPLVKDQQSYYDELKVLWDEIKDMRKRAMASKEGMFSSGNKVFKLLRRNKTLSTLIDLMKQTKRKIFTIPENLTSFKRFFFSA